MPSPDEPGVMADPNFSVAADPDDVADGTLVVGLAAPGMAGLSAVDYLVRQHDFEQVGHVRARGVPAIAPFEDGRPRHPIRVYADETAGLTALVCELFVPVQYTEPFCRGLADWLDGTSLSEVAVLHGIPYPHGPESHRVFTTATPDYHDRRLADADLEPLSGGFFDGLVGDLVLESLDGAVPPVGVFVTPGHPPGPDLDAAVRLLDALEGVYDVTVDRAERDQSAAQLRRYYEELAGRVQDMEAEAATGTREYPEDRMFM